MVGRWSGGEHAARHGVHDYNTIKPDHIRIITIKTQLTALLDEGTHRVQGGSAVHADSARSWHEDVLFNTRYTQYLHATVILYRIHVPAGNERTDRVWAWEQDLMLSHCCPVVGDGTQLLRQDLLAEVGSLAPEQQQLVSELRETSPFTHHSLHANCMPLV